MQEFLRPSPVNHNIEVRVNCLVKHALIFRQEFQVYEIRCVQVLQLFVALLESHHRERYQWVSPLCHLHLAVVHLEFVFDVLTLLINVRIFQSKAELRLKFPVFQKPHLCYYLTHLRPDLLLDYLVALIHLRARR